MCQRADSRHQCHSWTWVSLLLNPWAFDTLYQERIQCHASLCVFLGIFIQNRATFSLSYPYLWLNGNPHSSVQPYLFPKEGCSGVMTWFASSHRKPYRSPSSLQMKERTRKRHGDTRFDYSIHEENKIAAESNGIILDKFFFLVLRERLAVRYGNDPQF